MAGEFGYASQPIESNREVGSNSLYTGLAVAGVAGAVGLAYGMDQTHPRAAANKERAAVQNGEKRQAKRERMQEAKQNRKDIRRENIPDVEQVVDNEKAWRPPSRDQFDYTGYTDIDGNTRAGKKTLENAAKPKWKQAMSKVVSIL